jgi:hypothetical protein
MAAAIGAATGIGIALAGGRLLSGSIASLVDAFPESPIRLDGLRALGLPATTGFESGLFVIAVTAALLARKRLHSGN